MKLILTAAINKKGTILMLLGLTEPTSGSASILGMDPLRTPLEINVFMRNCPVLKLSIYRDALSFGKVLGAVAALALVLLALWLLVIGSPMLFLGIPPSGEQIARAIVFYFATVLCGAIWFIIAMLYPSTRTLVPVVFTHIQGAVTGSPLSFGQSLLLIWPHLTGLSAGLILIFVLAYIKFQRVAIRA